MEYVTDKGIILMVLISDILIIGSVILILLMARLLSDKYPDYSERIIRAVCIITPAIVVVFGLLAETIVILNILWTIGYI